MFPIFLFVVTVSLYGEVNTQLLDNVYKKLAGFGETTEANSEILRIPSSQILRQTFTNTYVPIFDKQRNATKTEKAEGKQNATIGQKNETKYVVCPSMVPLKKRKFYMQVKPVRPANEMDAEDETIYYIESDPGPSCQ